MEPWHKTILVTGVLADQLEHKCALCRLAGGHLTKLPWGQEDN